MENRFHAFSIPDGKLSWKEESIGAHTASLLMNSSDFPSEKPPCAPLHAVFLESYRGHGHAALVGMMIAKIQPSFTWGCQISGRCGCAHASCLLAQTLQHGCLQEEAASRPQPLAGLHVHRKTLAIIGILHCPAATEFKRAYVRFEQVCR